MLELSYILAIIFSVISCIRLLHLHSLTEWPELFANGTSFNNLSSTLDQYWTTAADAVSGNNEGGVIRKNTDSTRESASNFLAQLVQHTPILQRRYVPPLFWGRSGHIQTIIRSTLGRNKMPKEKGDSRHSVVLSDGSTITFDLFLPQQQTNHQGKDVTLVVCPGIGNSSESMGITVFAHHANNNGYRVAVLNHLGVIPNIPLTSPRIFTYGSTEEYGAMVDEVKAMYPDTTLIAVGFSMGGNLVCKYLGESAEHRNKITAAISCCQGYDINRALELLQSWRHLGYGYLRAVYVCVSRVLHNFQEIMLNDEMLERYNLASKSDVLGSNDLLHVDDIFLSKVAGYESREEYYTVSSCASYMNEIDIPVLLINAKDDPLIPVEVLDVPLTHTAVNDKSLFVLTKHGGHLGFYECAEGSKWLVYDEYTWLDRVIVEYVGAVLLVSAAYNKGSV